MINWLKKLFCWHKWKYIEQEARLYTEPKYGSRICKKCGLKETRPVTGVEIYLGGWK